MTPETFFGRLVGCRHPGEAKRFWADHYVAPAGRDGSAVPLTRQEYLASVSRQFAAYLSQLEAGGASVQMPDSGHFRAIYRKLPPGVLTSGQPLVQGFRSGLVYDFQGENCGMKFETVWKFLDLDGEAPSPYFVPDKGVVEGYIVADVARPFHRMMMEGGEPFHITDAVSRRIAACALYVR